MSHLSFWLHSIWHPLQNSGYQFWSGLGSDISEVMMFGAIIGLYRRHNCHVHRCPWLGKYAIEVDGHPFLVCGRHRNQHHPDAPKCLTEDHLG